MRKIKYFNLCLLVLICLFICACDYVKLPPQEQSACPYKEGERFYCEVDGKPFRPNDNGYLFMSTISTYYFKDKNVSDDINQGYSFSFNVEDRRHEAEVSNLFLGFIVPINNVTPTKIILGKNQLNSGLSKLDTLKGYIRSEYKVLNGEILISKIDTVTKRISGEFQFNCYKVKDPETISEIKNGHFNNLYFPYQKFSL
jgi:Family of unknown function (DUF6252)